MQEHHELWLTALFNQYLAGPANAALALVGVHPHDPAKPWSNFMTMQILVAVIIMIVFAFLRPRLSMDRPGKLQHIFEEVYGFLHNQADEAVGHHGVKWVAFFGTLFIFILFANLIGVIPSFESPTMFPAVPAGCAIAAFLYYNYLGMKENGVGKYLAHFVGPMPLLAPLMIPIEIISHLARPLSLTIRLYANMYAGEQVTLAFLGLTYLVFPAIFMGLHVFVSFLQAFVFTLLTMIYVGGATAHEEH
ncbi:MAG: F0F1 ATP synthase subunit A [Bryobacteraceae bacterium]|nr:F0F1 ATP synthase subunit A [Bryobacteraceae bacterium]